MPSITSSVFKHHQAIDEADMKRLTIGGYNGAFRELRDSYEQTPNEATVGVGVEMNSRGDIIGAKVLMCGTVSIPKVNTKDLFPNRETPGAVVFSDFDLSIFKCITGLLISAWVDSEDNFLPWKIKVKQGGKTKFTSKCSA